MNKRIVTGLIGGVIFLCAAFFFPIKVSLWIFVLIFGIGILEFSRAVLGGKSLIWFQMLGLFSGLAITYFAAYSQFLICLFVAAGYVAFGAICRLFVPFLTAKRLFSCFFGVLVVPFLLSSVLRIGLNAPGKMVAVILPCFIAWFTDMSAMNGGARFGRHKLVPKISPKKTVEGALFGLFGGVIAGLVCYFILPEIGFSLVFCLLLGLFGSVVSQFGDLSLSFVKRKCQIKDFGTILPGHGGILDRFDSVMLCAPFVEIVLRLAGIIG